MQNRTAIGLNMLSLEMLFIGLAKLKSHAGVCNLDSKAVLVNEIREELMELDDPMSDEQSEIHFKNVLKQKI